MISLQAVNQAICALYQKALNAAGTGAELVAEDVSKPIIRPSGKVELEDGTDARLLASGRERTADAKCPESFSGFPIALISAGLLALAFMGFSGMKIF